MATKMTALCISTLVGNEPGPVKPRLTTCITPTHCWFYQCPMLTLTVGGPLCQIFPQPGLLLFAEWGGGFCSFLSYHDEYPKEIK